MEPPSSSLARDRPVEGGNAHVTLDSVTTTLTPAFTRPERQMLDWNDLNFAQDFGWADPSLDLDHLLIEQSNMTTDQNSIRHIGPGTPAQREVAFHNISIPTSPSTYALRSLVLRTDRDPGQQRIANLALSTLKSYPLMIMHHKTFPPFIHAQSMLLHSDNDNMEPLADCLSLMYMIGGNLRGSRKLFWKNVSMECERLREEVCKIKVMRAI